MTKAKTKTKTILSWPITLSTKTKTKRKPAVDSGDFILTITLGNAAMQNARDVAASLVATAVRLKNGEMAGTISDTDGIIVGSFDLDTDEEED
jgi:hypothetical protein